MKIVILCSLFTVFSCTTISQNTVSTNPGPEKFTEMTAIKKDKCQFLLKDQSQQQYEVQNITSRIVGLKDGQKVWITYQPLRRMSQCGAQPIEITEVYQVK